MNFNLIKTDFIEPEGTGRIARLYVKLGLNFKICGWMEGTSAYWNK